MTCIVAWLRPNDVIMGGDSAAVGGLHVDTRTAPKVFKNGPMVFGFTGSFRMGDLLEHALVVPEWDDRKQSVDKYMRTTFIDAVRSCLKDGGYARTESDAEAAGCFLVGFEGRIFAIESDYQVGESRMPFAAIGCGDQYAKGSMMDSYLSLGDELDHQSVLERALQIASHFSGGVRPPFNFVTGGAKSGAALSLVA